MKINAYLDSLRLRTLFLSASGIILGSGIAASQGMFDVKIFIFALLTAVSLQILSNLANELGDYQKGTDNQQRTGPIRSIQQGEMSVHQLETMMFQWMVISMISGLLLVFFAFDSLLNPIAVFMLGIGAFSIVAAIFYTIGKRAYGYHGFGDIFVWLFFGIVSVMGGFFLQTKMLDFYLLLPASAIGFLATSVLNLNNIRDIENDRKYKKNTVCVRIGEKKGKIYHFSLIVLALITLILYTALTYDHWYNFFYLLTLPLFGFHVAKVKKYSGRALDRQFPVLVLSIFLLTLLIVAGIMW
ncbi:MAG: 1,4-dihydroxy-2-naphthoate octaprenyltransferase [Bacteroidales bacterium]|nr:1,4-dihydroxy-2-naphthoate octaprenyltransferase [Bacteroidales bacterium]